MANFIERLLPTDVRDRTHTMLAAALGFFLGSQYNQYITDVFNRYFPAGPGVIGGAIKILLITVFVVYVIAFLEKALDGK